MSILKFMWDLLISFDPEQYGLLYGFVRPNGLFKQAFSSGYEQGETVRVVITVNWLFGPSWYMLKQTVRFNTKKLMLAIECILNLWKVLD